MPQLIAMIIIVVGAMIYMFQTFGGTGDKIEGVAQKASVITEINNIKDGIKIAARSQILKNTAVATETGDAKVSLQGLAELKYFANQINEQLTHSNATTARTAGAKFNVYSAISFGGNSVNATAENGAMLIYLVNDKRGMIPGIFVDLSKGSLKDNAGFLESQIANDLKAVAYIDRKSITTASAALQTGGTTVHNRTPGQSAAGSDSDGMFTIYFQDFGTDEVVLDANGNGDLVVETPPNP